MRSAATGKQPEIDRFEKSEVSIIEFAKSSEALQDSSKRSASRTWAVWFVDGTLLIAAIAGVFYALPVQSEAGKLHARRIELQRKVGELSIRDPSKYHVILLKSDSPLEFRWRIFFPEKNSTMLSTECQSSTGSSSGMSSLSGSSDPAIEGLVIVKLLPIESNSSIQIWTSTRLPSLRGSNSMNLSDEVIQRMINSNDTSLWQIAGKKGAEVFSVEEVVELLTIQPPSEGDGPNKRAMIRIGLGTEKAIEKVRTQ